MYASKLKDSQKPIQYKRLDLFEIFNHIASELYYTSIRIYFK